MPLQVRRTRMLDREGIRSIIRLAIWPVRTWRRLWINIMARYWPGGGRQRSPRGRFREWGDWGWCSRWFVRGGSLGGDVKLGMFCKEAYKTTKGPQLTVDWRKSKLKENMRRLVRSKEKIQQQVINKQQCISESTYLTVEVLNCVRKKKKKKPQ